MFPVLFEVSLGKPELLLVLLGWEVGAGAVLGLTSSPGKDFNCRKCVNLTGAKRQVVEARDGVRGSGEVGVYVNRAKQIQDQGGA